MAREVSETVLKMIPLLSLRTPTALVIQTAADLIINGPEEHQDLLTATVEAMPTLRAGASDILFCPHHWYQGIAEADERLRTLVSELCEHELAAAITVIESLDTSAWCLVAAERGGHAYAYAVCPSLRQVKIERPEYADRLLLRVHEARLHPEVDHAEEINFLAGAATSPEQVFLAGDYQAAERLIEDLSDCSLAAQGQIVPTEALAELGGKRVSVGEFKIVVSVRATWASSPFHCHHQGQEIEFEVLIETPRSGSIRETMIALSCADDTDSEHFYSDDVELFFDPEGCGIGSNSLVRDGLERLVQEAILDHQFVA
jgi:hypothetical protein